MTQFENFKNMNLEELAIWLDVYGEFDNSPWMQWWDENFCDKCESIKMSYPDTPHITFPVGWCELEHKCKFFQDRDDMPSNKEIITMWLNSPKAE